MSIEPNMLLSWWQRSVVVLALLGSGCLELQRSEPTAERTCSACHGDERRAGDSLAQAAPPRDLNGNHSVEAMGVGAHERHLSKKGHAPVACAACHVVPETMFAPGHVDSKAPAEVIFGDLASAGQREPTYDHKQGSCSATYCHGQATVSWTAARTEKDACGTCHGLPPALPHPQKTQCSDCHGEVISASGNWIAPERHVDGLVDVSPQGKCASCHGTNSETGAPPPDLAGKVEPSARGVGAHVNHLSDTATHRAIACNECHQVPAEVDSRGHIDDDGRADITFGTLARSKRSRPTYSVEPVRCNNTYCHGATTGEWQAPRDPDAACGSCHGLPPPAPHTQLTQCSNCHGRVVGPDQKIIEPSLHVNGTVEVDYGSDCSRCHGSGTSGAPPPDLHGNTESASRGVGSHAVHLNAGPTHDAIACSECHRVPATVEEPKHIDGDDVAEVAFGPLASVNGHRPIYDSAKASCSNSYCHGDTEPVWQAPRSSAAACGSCHALPPPAPHPNAKDCSKCHGAVVNESRNIIAPELHVNGKVELSPVPCNACHGSSANGSPPPDTTGNTSTSARGVGAHALHLQAASTHGSIACNECHIVPLAWDAAGHIDTPQPAEVTFGILAKANGSSPNYSAADLNCTGSYCHGNAIPNWIQPRSSTDACGSCHGLPPPMPHPQKADCSQCHAQVIDSTRSFIAGDLHVNGKVELSPMQCNRCHGTDASASPPPDNNGSTNPSVRGVGAHAVHLQAAATHGVVACNECHVVPPAWDSPGHRDSALPAEVTFGNLAKASSSRPTYSAATATCVGSYCHGSATPNWTAPRAADKACGTCHALPPPAPHPQTKPCSLCHGEVIDAQGLFVRPEMHVDGKIQVLQNCAACHGSSASAAPPVDLSGGSEPTRVGVGAHQLHLSGGNYSRPLACGECHVVPATIAAPGHLDSGVATPADVVMSGPGAANSRNPQWDRLSMTCNGGWCHGPLDPLNQSPNWVSVPGSLTCASCHGMPPGPPHAADAQCSKCHGDVDSQNRITDRGQHINGDIDFL